MPTTHPPQHRSWRHRFGDALRGTVIAVRSQTTMRVHCLATCLVIGLGLAKGCSYWQWSVLVLCITLVIVAEMLNSSIESLVRVVTSKPDPRIRDALDMASGAVLVASAGAVIIGVYALVLS